MFARVAASGYDRPMSDVDAITVGEFEASSGVLEGITFHKAAGALGVTSFGISIVDLEPGAVRKVLPGPDGLRLLAVGGTPGRAYEAGGTL